MPLCIISMVGVVIGTFIYWQATSVLVVSIAVSIIGCLIYVPQFLIGLSAMELVPKFAVGTTVGMCGLFGYVGGSLVANAAIGVIVDSSLGWLFHLTINRSGFINNLLIYCSTWT